MENILKNYAKKLVNLSAGNRSLFLLKTAADKDVDLHNADFLLPGRPSFSVIEQLLAGAKKIPLCKSTDSRDEAGNLFSRRLQKIARTAAHIYEETGAQDLAIGYPIVEGKFKDGTPVRCPLLFFPVSLQLHNNMWELYPSPDMLPGINKNFLTAIAHYHQLKITGELTEYTPETTGNTTEFLTELYNQLKSSGPEINFNRELFELKLHKFREYRRPADFEQEYGHGILKLQPTAVLGIFPQAGSYLMPDYDFMIEEGSFTRMEDFFIKNTPAAAGISPTGGFIDKIKEEHTFCPFPTDIFQENAIKAVKAGYSPVVQGPPGTGKSQLICNLIADAIATGKNVLVVCQKRAALDVVYERLKQKKLELFCARVHDFKADRKKLYEQIAEQCENVEIYKERNYGLDTIHLERKHLAASRQIDKITEELEELRQALFNTDECGYSAKELYLLHNYALPGMKGGSGLFKNFDREKADSFAKKLPHLLPHAIKFDAEDYPWKHRIPFTRHSTGDLEMLARLLPELPRRIKLITARATDVAGRTVTAAELRNFSALEPVISQIAGLTDDDRAAELFHHLLKKGIPGKRKTETFRQQIAACFDAEPPEKSLATANLASADQAVEDCLASLQSPFRLLKWKLFSKDKSAVSQLLKVNGLSFGKPDLLKLKHRILNRMNLEHLLHEKTAQDYDLLPNGTDLREYEHYFETLKKASEACELWKSLRDARDLLPQSTGNIRRLPGESENISLLSREIMLAAVEAEHYLTETGSRRLFEDEDFVPQLLKALVQDFDSLCEYDTLKAGLTPYEAVLLDALTEQEEIKNNTESAKDAFYNSLYGAWIAHLETKYPILRSVSTGRTHRLEEELREAILEKRAVSEEIMLMKAGERTYRHLEYNRLKNLTTYRELNRQVTKKKKIWPVRKLMAELGSDVFSLIPCWLASPESVSAIFPMQQLFDLVIFDEASQCYAEKALPALYRGQSCVITGDSKQLQPNDLYAVRYEPDEDDEQEDEAAAEIDSLLDLASHYLMNVNLQEHYRSRTPELIAFSNFHFYKNRLRLLPDMHDLNTDKPAISYIKVNGVWENNSNLQEALTVCEKILELAINDPLKSVGVVTFNQKQQQLITELLEQKREETGKALPEHLFIKNIENVQGDECDILLFSIAYAPNRSGKMQARFGSLNAPGGENRLNVAVTRAREQVMVICSIYPEKLEVEDTLHDGPKLLKQYLEYALRVAQGREQRAGALAGSGQARQGIFLSERLDTEFNTKPAADSLSLVHKSELPFADLFVCTGNATTTGYKGAVLTDDNLLYRALSAKDSFGYLPLHLAQKNWKYKRVYSRDFWLAANENMEKLKTALHRM